MKSLPGSLKLLIIAAIGTGVIVGIRAVADCTSAQPQGDLYFAVRSEHAVKNEDTFCDIFTTLSPAAQYCFHMRPSPNYHGCGNHVGPGEYDITNMPTPAPTATPANPSKRSSQLEIQTDKVTVSEKAASSVELTAISSHTTVKIASSNPADIAKVLNALATPTPTASPGTSP